MGLLTRRGVIRNKCRSGPVEVKVSCVVTVDIYEEDGCTTNQAMREAAEQDVERSPQHYLKNVTVVDVEALGCG